jgi:hypothetical protein
MIEDIDEFVDEYCLFVNTRRLDPVRLLRLLALYIKIEWAGIS